MKKIEKGVGPEEFVMREIIIKLFLIIKKNIILSVWMTQSLFFWVNQAHLLWLHSVTYLGQHEHNYDNV